MSKNILLRVTQINAMFFDREIDKVLWHLIQDVLKYLPPGITASFEPELKLSLKLAIGFLSVVKLNRTFGQKLLQVQYANLTSNKKAIYMLLQCCDYVKERLLPSNPDNQYTKLAAKLELISKFAAVINILVFLNSGVKPRLIERFLNIPQVYEHDNIQRQFETKYMTRELLWNGLIEILVFVLPMINFHKVKRTCKTLNPFNKKTSAVNVNKTVIITKNSKCPTCSEPPIIPHHMGCSHVFCYTCLKGNQLADSKFSCPVCEFSDGKNTCEMVQVQS